MDEMRALIETRLRLGKKILELKELSELDELILVAFICDKLRDARKAIKTMQAMKCPETEAYMGNGLAYWRVYESCCLNMLNHFGYGRELVNALFV